MYLDGALGSTADGGILLLAGATLGGGTVVNYTTSFATPPSVREEWDRIAGLDGVFTGDGYDAALEAVQERLETNRDNGEAPTRDQILEKGLRNLGWHVDEMPRNVSGCTDADCGYCTMGCRIGAKKSILATYLQDASEGGARIVVGCDVETIDVGGSRAAGVHARVGDHALHVRAGAVVVAAGALNTPALLLRSGIDGPAVGRYLRLHPVTAVWGRFEERSSHGPAVCRPATAKSSPTSTVVGTGSDSRLPRSTLCSPQRSLDGRMGHLSSATSWASLTWEWPGSCFGIVITGG
jgi:hypothetical protein